MTNIVYMDNAATTRPFKEVLEVYTNISDNVYANPSSLHRFGFEAEKLMKKARNDIAACIGCQGKEIIFTSSGTESNNIAILGYLNANKRKGKHVLFASDSHPSVLKQMEFLIKNSYIAELIPINPDGRINPESLYSAIREDTVLVSVLLVNNETGVLQDIPSLKKAILQKNETTVLHADGIQAFGKLDLSRIIRNIEMLSVSGHKIHGPKGVAALYKKDGLRLEPLFYGGGQEGGLRSGTENLPAICAFSKASELILKNFHTNTQKYTELKRKLAEGILGVYKTAVVNSSHSFSLPHILNVSIPGIKPEVLLHILEDEGIFASTVSACSSKKQKESHVLKAMGIKGEVLQSALRFSFGAFNNIEEVDIVLKALETAIKTIAVKAI